MLELGRKTGKQTTTTTTTNEIKYEEIRQVCVWRFFFIRFSIEVFCSQFRFILHIYKLNELFIENEGREREATRQEKNK